MAQIGRFNPSHYVVDQVDVLVVLSVLEWFLEKRKYL